MRARPVSTSTFDAEPTVTYSFVASALNANVRVE